jgi:hypothetical protein
VKHWRNGGSTARRQINCIPWQFLADKIPRVDTAGAAAKVGTALHQGMDVLLTDPIPLDDAEVSSLADMAEVTVDEMLDLLAEKLYPALDYIRAMPYEHLQTETALPHPTDDQIGGTTDVMLWDNTTFTLLDYKTGDGKLADDMDQLFFYAYMLSLNPSPAEQAMRQAETVNLMLLQAYRGEIIPTTHPTTYAEIKLWGERYEAAVALSRSDNLPDPTPGDWCRFCPAHPVCPAKQALSVRAMDITVRDDIQAALDAAVELEEWIANVRKVAHEQLENGQEIPGWKLVPKRATRRWTSVTAAEAAAAGIDGAVEHKLRSPAQIQKLCKQQGLDYDELFGNNVSSVSTGSTLVPESDPRRPILNVNSLRRELEKLG